MLVLMRRAAILLACVLVVALAPIVHRGGDSSRTAVGDTPCLNAATAEAARVGTPTSASLRRFSIPDNEAQCRLRRALLTRADVAGDWNRDRGDDGHSYGTEDADCGTPLPEIVAGLTDSFFDDNAQDGALYGLFQRVYAFKQGGASDLMTALRRNCSLLAAERADQPSAYGFLDPPAVGDESFGLSVLLGHSSEETDKPAGIVYIRRGDLVTIVTLMTDGDLDAALSQVGKLAAEKQARVGPMPEPTYAPGEGCGPSPTPHPAVSEALSGGMLTLDDTPAGFVHDPPGPCRRIDEQNDCNDLGDAPPEPIGWINTGFKGQYELRIVSNVALYKAGDAESVIDALRRGSRRPVECHASVDGQTYTRHWDPVDAPSLGDNAVALHFTTRGLPTEANYYVILIRRGRTIATVAFQPERDPFDRAETIPVDFTRLAKRADSRLESIQQRLSGD